MVSKKFRLLFFIDNLDITNIINLKAVENRRGIKMHFYCTCGYRISDTTDFLSYKAYILADQDQDDFFDGMEKLIRSALLIENNKWLHSWSDND